MTAPACPEMLVLEQDGMLLGAPGGSALFNEARTHRYLLTRTWSPAPPMTWIMLNPSTADAFAEDATIRRCVTFAKREGCGGIKVANLYGFRATNPLDLWRVPDPVGPSNDMIIGAHASGGYVVAAWGNLGAVRSREVARRLNAAGVNLLCLGVTASGQPVHPLARGRHRVRDTAPLLPWTPPPGGAGDGDEQ